MGVNKKHDEFHILDMNSGWEGPPGYPKGIQQKILSGALDERHKTSSGAEEIVVVDLDRGVERPPTSDEIERGIFYSDFEQYKEGKAA